MFGGNGDSGTVLLYILILVLVILLLGWIVSMAWNYTIPEMFPGVNRITTLQGIVLLILIGILFGHAGYANFGLMSRINGY